MSEFNQYFKKSGNNTHYDNFYDYLDGGKPLPDGLVIGNDCKRKHGKNGKTVRRIYKCKKVKSCLMCERLTKQDRRYKAKETTSDKHLDAMDLYESQQEEDLFLI